MKLQLSYPTETYLVTQTFGANPQIYANPKYGGIQGHNGLDSIAQHGYSVHASHDGWAWFEVDQGGGHGVVIVTDKEFDYKEGTSYFKTIYWHLCDGKKEPQFKSPLEGKTGLTKVKNGDVIGYADNTGASTGDHLHFGLKPCQKDIKGNFYNIETNNGFLGAINPNPYFDGSTPSQIANLSQQISFLEKMVAMLKQKLGI